MDDASDVGRVEGVGDLDGEVKQRVERLWPARDPVLECGSGQVFQDNERLALRLADVVDRADVGMVESGRGASLALKPLERLRISCKRLREELEGDSASQPHVLGLVDHTHAATA